ncbi:hypothetical protein DR999_PMT09318 [Platysternon megacephalum]|uniref:Immunoglobulin domain-containing protein n=1 Tax=Platysternon megacephalum TaxID=55544 RepID=A0A4D9ECK7_9SAUR|nr:hypothetical protein DR999_PMT09318 [Platysternon megacephalum]
MNDQATQIVTSQKEVLEGKELVNNLMKKIRTLHLVSQATLEGLTNFVHSDVTTVNGMLGSSVTLHHEYPDLEHPVHVTWNKGKTLLSSWTRRTRAIDGMRTVRGIVEDCVMLDLHNYTNRRIHVTWKKGNKQVAKMKGQPVKGSGTYSERFCAFPNGSLSVCPMQPGDEGQYTAEVFDHDGAGLGHQKIQLECSRNKTALVQEVTGIVGGSMFLPLAVMDWKDLVQIMWKKDSLLVAELNYSQSESDGRSTYRSQILPNGTLRLDRIQESDCGRYSVEVRDRDGKIIYQRMIDVKVEQETVASPVNSHLLLFTIVGVHVAVVIVVLGSLIWHFGKCKHRTGRMTNLSFRHVTLGRSGYDEDLVECGEGDTSSPDQEENGNPASQEPEAANSTKQENEAFIKNAKETKAATAASFYTEQPLSLNISTFQVHSDVTTVNWTLGGFVTFHLDYPDFEHPAEIIWKKGNTLLYNGTYHMNRFTVFSNGTSALKNTEKEDAGQYTSRSLQLKNGSKKDEGKYEFALTNISKKSFLLKVSEPTQIPAVHVSDHIDKGGELPCERANRSSLRFRWTRNEHPVALTETEVDGKWIILAKEVTGKLDCQIHHKNSINECSVIELECNEGDLLQQPLFLYTLAACGGGAIVLAVIASLVTCCCLKSKQQFIPVPSEEEKEEEMVMSETKSPPNGDHHEAPSAPDDSPPNPESTETCQGLEAEPKMEAESEVTPDPEVVVDINNEEFLCDSFPDPIDP